MDCPAGEYRPESGEFVRECFMYTAHGDWEEREGDMCGNHHECVLEEMAMYIACPPQGPLDFPGEADTECMTSSVDVWSG
jgi:hypothetical protein